jgi:ubiquinone/menaquinone biosynthesis C-methylase UbiE
MDFKAFEQIGWEQCAKAYDHYLGPLTRQATRPLLDGLQIEPGWRLLDLAMGPGYVAAAAVQRGALVTGVDFSERMVVVAQSLHRSVFALLAGDAENLPFAAESFDAVAVNFGVLHFPHPERAFAEARRILKPGGRFGFTAWAQPEEGEGLAIVNRALQRYGQTVVDVPDGPAFFRFGDPEECERSLRAAGFVHVWSRPLPLEWALRSNEDFFAALVHGTARLGGVLRKQSEQALQAIRAAVNRDCQRYWDGDKLLVPMPALLAISEK